MLNQKNIGRIVPIPLKPVIIMERSRRNLTKRWIKTIIVIIIVRAGEIINMTPVILDIMIEVVGVTEGVEVMIIEAIIITIIIIQILIGIVIDIEVIPSVMTEIEIKSIMKSERGIKKVLRGIMKNFQAVLMINDLKPILREIIHLRMILFPVILNLAVIRLIIPIVMKVNPKMIAEIKV